MRILILEDERATAQLLGMLLTTSGHTVLHAADGTEGLKQLRANPCDLVFSDVQMVPMDGFAFLAQARSEFPRLLVVLASACSDLHARVEKQPHKPFDIVHKPFRIEEVKRVLKRANDALAVQAGIAQATVAAAQTSPEKIAESLLNLFPGTAFAQARAGLARAIRQSSNALIVAERGLLGAETLQLWREFSPQPDAPWQFVDVTEDPARAQAALLTESGEPGPATEAAKGGTLVIQSFDSFPPGDQARLFSHLRGVPPTRVILTVRRDPDLLLDEGLIDEAIYFRLSSLAVPIPALVELPEHIDGMFIDALRASPGYPFGSADVQIEPAAFAALRAYRWPENMVELRNVAAWTASRMRGPRVTLSQFPERFQRTRIVTLAEALGSAQRDHLRRAMRVNPSALEAAQALGVGADELAAAMQPDGPLLFTLGGVPIATTKAPDEPVAAPARSHPPFLVVAGDERLRHAIEAQLAALGLEARVATDGLQAIAQMLMSASSPKIALVAGATPPFDTHEMIQELRRIEPELVIATIGIEGEIENTHSFPALESMDIFPVIIAHLLEDQARVACG